jgi:threonine dehydratase
MLTEVSRRTIAEAERSIRPHIRRTPIVEADGADFGLAGVRLVFKLEFLQHAGSFKTRGAFANLLLRDIPKAGVAAASGGNHGAAVAYAAMRLGAPARIFVPEISSPAKTARIKSYGAELLVGGALYADALSACEAWTKDSGALSAHAYDSFETMSGAGTIGLELEEQAADLDALLVAVGGGGLLGGVAAWFETGPKLVGVEPELAPSLDCALRAGRPVPAPGGGIAADSLAPKSIGEKPFAVIRDRISANVLVPDEAIRAAQEMLWDRLRVVVEPGAAAPFAALVSGAYKPPAGARVGVVLSGANTTAVRFAP